MNDRTDMPHAAPLPPARSKSLRYAVAIGSLVAVVAGLAWVTQQLPGWRSPKRDPAGTPVSRALNILKFSLSNEGVNLAVWESKHADPKERGFPRPFEKGVLGHFDFPFENPSDQNAELGFLQSTCGCLGVEVALVPAAEWAPYEEAIRNDPLKANAGAAWDWKKLEEHKTQGIVVPPGGKGFIRVAWRGRKEPGESLNIQPTIWVQPQGKMAERAFEKLLVPVFMSASVEFSPPKANAGVLGVRDTGQAKFLFWSFTRPDLNLTLDENLRNPLLKLNLKRLTAEEMTEMRERIKRLTPEEFKRKQSEGEVFPPIAVAAYWLEATVHEQVKGKQLDQGLSHFYLPVLLDGDKLPTEPPMVLARVKGDIDIGPAENPDKVNLRSFPASEGTRVTVPFWNNNAKLDLEAAEQEIANLEVKVSKQETIGNRTKWILEVRVPERGFSGPLPDHSAIILRTKTTPPRYIRIQLVGNAVQG
ncbi:MAG: hypothetical protein HY040_28340 [Planctomycetes bacterium]|nr:hypothetical protein [Planctomycetota bacterium]